MESTSSALLGRHGNIDMMTKRKDIPKLQLLKDPGKAEDRPGSSEQKEIKMAEREKSLGRRLVKLCEEMPVKFYFPVSLAW